MSTAASESPDLIVLATTRPGVSFSATGRTVHRVGGAPVTDFSELRIARYPDETSCYLLYYDRQGQEVTDTWHETLQSALDQAAFEFSLGENDWTFRVNA